MRLMIRRHWPLASAFALASALLLALGGGMRVTALVSGGAERIEESVEDIAGSVDLFDDTIVHAISIEIGAEVRERMDSTYRETGRKDWFPATVVIDGTRITRVGLRLKGNSTLEEILGAPGGETADTAFPAGEAPPGREGRAPGDAGRPCASDRDVCAGSSVGTSSCSSSIALIRSSARSFVINPSATIPTELVTMARAFIFPFRVCRQ